VWRASGQGAASIGEASGYFRFYRNDWTLTSSVFRPQFLELRRSGPLAR
jgi:hypothetical protein